MRSRNKEGIARRGQSCFACILVQSWCRGRDSLHICGHLSSRDILSVAGTHMNVHRHETQTCTWRGRSHQLCTRGWGALGLETSPGALLLFSIILILRFRPKARILLSDVLSLILMTPDPLVSTWLYNRY